MANAAEHFDIELSAGTVHAQRFGKASAPLVIAVHGLSANMHAFDVIGDYLCAQGLQLVASDLRGRGLSEITGPGTYGVRSHAFDALELARHLNADRFMFLGWSLGALIGMQAAALEPGRVSHLVLIDHVGLAEAGAVETIIRRLDRLDRVVASAEEYTAAIRATGLTTPWDEQWERSYRYELERQQDGALTPRTSKAAALEDLEDAGGLDVSSLWRAIGAPTLLLRATVPLPGGLLVPSDAANAMHRAVAGMQLVEIERNHFGIMTAPETAEAIAAFLEA
jgi:pimeloyl-ACP methyl ester carboxylesterase